MRNILIIHPGGNLSNNPNLTAIVKLLYENNFVVDILSVRQPEIFQEAIFENCNFILVDLKSPFSDSIEILTRELRKNYCLIIGIDLGIVTASILAQKWRIPYIYVSYEILFSDEIGLENKREEIEACKNISFAVCQDPIRSQLLSIENQIPQNIILNIPVSDFYNGPYPRSNYLREKFKIEDDKQIALFAGTISTRSMINEIIEQVNNWPENWVLVLHTYDSSFFAKNFYIPKYYRNHKIFLSDIPMKNHEEMQKLICSADLGIALFRPTFFHKYTGKNILFLGLSSGKVSTYLKYGIPVLINEVGQLSDYVRKYNLGLVIQRKEEINPGVLDNYLPMLSENCTRFYIEKLDFNLVAIQFLEIIKACCYDLSKHKLNDLIVNDKNKYSFSQSHLYQLKAFFIEEQEILSSLYYKSGFCFFHPLKSIIETAKKMINEKIRYKKISQEFQMKEIILGFITKS